MYIPNARNPFTDCARLWIKFLIWQDEGEWQHFYANQTTTNNAPPWEILWFNIKLLFIAYTKWFEYSDTHSLQFRVISFIEVWTHQKNYILARCGVTFWLSFFFTLMWIFFQFHFVTNNITLILMKIRNLFLSWLYEWLNWWSDDVVIEKIQTYNSSIPLFISKLKVIDSRILFPIRK